MAEFFQYYLKLFFILTPFFVISTFLVMTKELADTDRRSIAIKVTFAVMTITLTMFWFGKWIFMVFGITIDAFRIGAGVMLFLSALSLVQGNITKAPEDNMDIAVVPLALPVTVGPGTIGILLVMGTELQTFTEKLWACGALLTAICTVGFLLVISVRIEKLLGQQGLAILSKITGLFIASIAAQLIFTGIKNFMQ